MTRRQKTISGVAGAAVLGALVFGVLHVAGGLRMLDLVACDRFFKLRGARRGDERVVFVDIDDTTIRELGRFPLPREKYAELIELLSEDDCRALAVGFDIFLVEPSPDPAIDTRIGEAARRHGRTFFPAIFPEPFAPGPQALRSQKEARSDLVDSAYLLLEGDAGLRARFRADSRGTARELSLRMGVSQELLDDMVVRLLDERDLQNARALVRQKSGGDTRAFLRGEIDERFGGVSETRLAWMKTHTQAQTNADILWEKIYAPALTRDPKASLMSALAGSGVSYEKLIAAPRLGAEQHRMLRAHLAGHRGVPAEAFGPGVLCAYAGTVPEEYPVLPVLDASAQLVSAQPYLGGGDGKVRNFPLLVVQGGRAYPAMGLAMALQALGVRFGRCRVEKSRFVIPVAGSSRDVRLPIDSMGRVLIDWKAPWPHAYRHVSLGKLLPGRGSGEDATREARRLARSLKGKLVFVGLTATGTHDLNPIPLQERYPMVGVHGHVADGVLNGFFPRGAGAGLVLVLVLLCAVLGAVTGGVLNKVMSPFVALLGGGAAFFGCFAALPLAGVLFPPVAALGALGLSYVGALFWRYLVTEREGRKVRQVFAFRTSPELVEEMMRNPEVVQLGGKRVSATIFFADLGGFTTVAESTQPEDLIVLLNAYLSEISAAVIEGGGYLDKYEGDAVMAILGAPVERKDHAAAACRAALDTQSRLERLRSELGAAGRPLFRCRVGLASGDVVAGNIGSQTRFDYTALGDNVNLASRLEGVNKVYGTRILVSEKTADTAGNDFVFREVDRIRVKGRRGASRVLELVGRAGDLDETKHDGLADFARALELYRGRGFDGACDLFIQANGKLGGSDGPCETMIGRCQRYTVKPPPEGWDGVYEMTGK